MSLSRRRAKGAWLRGLELIISMALVFPFSRAAGAIMPFNKYMTKAVDSFQPYLEARKATYRGYSQLGVKNA